MYRAELFEFRRIHLIFLVLVFNGSDDSDKSVSTSRSESSVQQQRSQRSSKDLGSCSTVVRHSISEKKRVVRFNTCVDAFVSMLSVILLPFFLIIG